jgi:hypothetical protein
MALLGIVAHLSVFRSCRDKSCCDFLNLRYIKQKASSARDKLVADEVKIL